MSKSYYYFYYYNWYQSDGGALFHCIQQLMKSSRKFVAFCSIVQFTVCLALMLAFALRQVKTKSCSGITHKFKDIYHTWLCLATENTGSRLRRAETVWKVRMSLLEFACACVCVEFRFHLGHPYCLRLRLCLRRQ